MKVVILCGGQGTRIREETVHRPKPMVEIGGRPILWHIMKLYSSHGYNDFVLCLGYKQEVIREYFWNYRVMNSDITVSLNHEREAVIHSDVSEPWTVTLVDTGEKTAKGARIKRVSRYLDDQPFMLTYGDGVSDVDVGQLVASHREKGALATFTGVHPISRFATVETDDEGRINDWEEKKALEDYINGGFFVLEPEVLDYIDGDVEFEEEPMKRLAREGKVSMFPHEGFWHCMDTYRDYVVLENLWTAGRAPWRVWND